MSTFTDFLDSALADVRPSHVALVTAATTALTVTTVIPMLQPGHLHVRLRNSVWRLFRVVADPLLLKAEVETAAKHLIQFPQMTAADVDAAAVVEDDDIDSRDDAGIIATRRPFSTDNSDGSGSFNEVTTARKNNEAQSDAPEEWGSAKSSSTRDSARETEHDGASQSNSDTSRSSSAFFASSPLSPNGQECKYLPCLTALPRKGASLERVEKAIMTMASTLDNGKALRPDVYPLLSGALTWSGGGPRPIPSDVLARILRTYVWSSSSPPEFNAAPRVLASQIGTMLLSLFHGHSGTCSERSPQQETNGQRQQNQQSSCATLTTGPNESHLLAFFCYREEALRLRSGGTVLETTSNSTGSSSSPSIPSTMLPFPLSSSPLSPPVFEIIASTLAPPTLDHAAQLLQMRLVRVVCEPASSRVDLYQVERHINTRTIALVGCTPNAVTGAVDSVGGLAKIAERYGLHLHVDASLGGLVVPFLDHGQQPRKDKDSCGNQRDAQFTFDDQKDKDGVEEWGESCLLSPSGVPEKGVANSNLGGTPIDFRLPAVSTIVCDLSHYSGCPPGLGACLFRSQSLRAAGALVSASYPGGLYAATGGIVGDSLTASTIAAAWATLMANGFSRYSAAANAISQTTRQLATALASGRTSDTRSTHRHDQRHALPGIKVIGEPDLGVVAFTTADVDVFEVLRRLRARGYLLAALQNPPGLKLSITLELTDPIAQESFLRALASTLREARGDSGTDGSADTIDDEDEIFNGIQKYQSIADFDEESDDKKVKAQEEHEAHHDKVSSLPPLHQEGSVHHRALVYGAVQSVPDFSLVEDLLRIYTIKYDTFEPPEDPFS